MSSVKPRLVVANDRQSARAGGQKSFARIIDGPRLTEGRGRAGRRGADRRLPAVPGRSRVLVVADVTRAEAIDRWVALINDHCGTRERCAVMFDVTFQTACNWFDGVSAPSAAAMFQAVDWWGDDMARAA